MYCHQSVTKPKLVTKHLTTNFGFVTGWPWFVDYWIFAFPAKIHYRADFRHVPSQWETSLRSNAVSHWMVTKSALYYITLLELLSWYTIIPVKSVWSIWRSGPHVNIKTVFSRCGYFYYKYKSWDHLIFIMGIPLVRWCIYIEMVPWVLIQYKEYCG